MTASQLPPSVRGTRRDVGPRSGGHYQKKPESVLDLYGPDVKRPGTLPDGFDEYAWEVETKGNFSAARLSFSGKNYRLRFFDPMRLGQEVESDIQQQRVFFEPNLVVVPSVTKENMQKAIDLLTNAGRLASLVAE